MADVPPDGDLQAEFVTFKYPLPHLGAALGGHATGEDRGDGIIFDGRRGQTSCPIRTSSRCI